MFYQLLFIRKYRNCFVAHCAKKSNVPIVIAIVCMDMLVIVERTFVATEFDYNIHHVAQYKNGNGNETKRFHNKVMIL